MELTEHPRIGILTVKKLLAQGPSPVWSVGAGILAGDALRRMAENDIGAIVVMDGNRFAGVFSEQDYLRRVVLEEPGMAQATVGELVTPCTVFAVPEQTAQQCLATMMDHRLRHLPVLDHDQAVGLLSREAVLLALVAHQRALFAAIELDQRILFLQGTYSC